MIKRLKNIPALAGISGGENVKITDAGHGLGRADDLNAALLRSAQAQGITGYVPLTIATQQPLADATSEAPPSNAIALPLPQLLHDAVEQSCPAPSADAQQRDLSELIERSIHDSLRELLPPNAMLFIPPEDFTQLRTALVREAQEMVGEMRALAASHCKKTPVNEQALRNKLRRDLASVRFRDKYSEVFDAVREAKEAPPKQAVQVKP